MSKSKEEIWSMYILALEIMLKICKRKCFSYGMLKVEDCEIYIKDKIEKNELKALKNYDKSKGAKESTYLYMLISSRAIDFCRTLKKIPLIETFETPSVEDTQKILEILNKTLTNEEFTTLMFFYIDELTYKEIALIYSCKPREIENILKRAKKKSHKILNEKGIKLEDLLD